MSEGHRYDLVMEGLLSIDNARFIQGIGREATSSSCHGEIAQPTAMVEHVSLEVRPCSNFKGNELSLALGKLALKLLIEELNAVTGAHAGCRAPA